MKDKAHVIDAGELQAYHTEYSESRQELADQNADHAAILSRMEQRGYHRAAFKLVAQLCRHDITKAQDFMRAFTQYSAILGLEEKLGSQGDLIDAEEREEADAA